MTVWRPHVSARRIVTARGLAVGLLVCVGIGAVAVAGWSLAHGGIGWDSRGDTEAAVATRSVDSSWTLARAYASVPLGNEFYGVFLQQFADALHLLVSGTTTSPGADDPAAYVYQGLANVILSVLSVTALAVAVAVAFRSALAGAFLWALTLSTPLWLGMSHVDFKDMPLAAGLTLVTAGPHLQLLDLATVVSHRRRRPLRLGRRDRPREPAGLAPAADGARGGLGDRSLRDRPVGKRPRAPHRGRRRRRARRSNCLHVGHEPDRAHRHAEMAGELDSRRALVPVGLHDPDRRAGSAEAPICRSGTCRPGSGPSFPCSRSPLFSEGRYCSPSSSSGRPQPNGSAPRCPSCRSPCRGSRCPWRRSRAVRCSTTASGTCST